MGTELQFIEAEPGVSVAVEGGRVYIVGTARPRVGTARARLVVVEAGTGKLGTWDLKSEVMARAFAAEMARCKGMREVEAVLVDPRRAQKQGVVVPFQGISDLRFEKGTPG